MTNPDRHDISAGLRFSPINPLTVTEIVACWRRVGEDVYEIGFVARLPDKYPLGEYAYIYTKSEFDLHRESVSTQYFNDLPAHLYLRAADWITEGPILAQINQSLGYSKAHAQHGTSTSAFGGSDTGSVFRFPG